MQKLIDIIYPPVCGICGKLDSNFLCKKCEKILDKQAKFKIINNIGDEKSSKLLYIFKYQGIIRKMMLEYKFDEKSYLYKTFVNFLLKNKKFFQILKTYDTIVPVPISGKRKKERGYNQSLLIAKELGKRIGVPVASRALCKTKNIVAQSKLNKRQRQENIVGAYSLGKTKGLENAKILLFDDIYTTGSTIKECAKTLKKAKPKKIDYLTIAKD